jgi:prepilin-type N-terminal cleavage/methylation domain-containing protein
MNNNGFSLMELMIATAIFTIACIGLLGVFTGCFILNEMSRNLTLAINGAEKEMERIRNLPFNQISAQDGNIFEIAGIADEDSEGMVSVDDSNPNLLVVTVSVSWRQSNGRVVGGDKNLNGVLDTGETLDSPAQLISLMANRYNE